VISVVFVAVTCSSVAGTQAERNRKIIKMRLSFKLS
jgi:hypothetical protein